VGKTGYWCWEVLIKGLDQARAVHRKEGFAKAVQFVGINALIHWLEADIMLGSHFLITEAEKPRLAQATE
jgi:hypothetical protein